MANGSDEKTTLETVRATQTTPPTTTPEAPKDSPPATVAPGHTAGKTETTTVDFGTGQVSPEDWAKFQRDAQILPADQVKVPGTDMTLAQLKAKRKEAEKQTAPTVAREATANAVRETSTVAPSVKVGVTADGTIISTPLSLSADDLRNAGKQMAEAALKEPEPAKSPE